MNVAEVLQLPDRTIVDHVIGRLISLGEYERKTRPDGEAYTAQSFTMAGDDERGDVVFGTVYDHYPLDTHKGQVLYFCSMKSRNGRFGGVTTAKVEQGGIFNRKPAQTVLRMSKAGAIHTKETFALLKRKATETKND